MKKSILTFFMLLAAIGLVLSATVHCCALFGWKFPFPDLAWSLHGGIFVVWFPAVFMAQKLAKGCPRKDLWKVALRGCPPWLKGMTYFFLGYAVLNFFLFSSGSSYGKHDYSGIGGFSGHWMAFYAAALALLYSALHTDLAAPVVSRSEPAAAPISSPPQQARQAGAPTGPSSRALRTGNVVIFLCCYLALSAFLLSRFLPGKNLLALEWNDTTLFIVPVITLLFAPIASCIIVVIFMKVRYGLDDDAAGGLANIRVSDLFFTDADDYGAPMPQRRSGEQPRWVKVVVPLFMLLVFATLTYQNYADRGRPKPDNDRIIASAAGISPQTVKNITVRLWKGGDDRPVTLDEAARTELASRIGRMQPAPSGASMRYGKWQYYRGIDIDAEKPGQYRIVLMSRGDGPVLGSFQITGEPISYNLYFDADDLWRWLKQLPIIAWQEDSTGPITPR